MYKQKVAVVCKKEKLPLSACLTSSLLSLSLSQLTVGLYEFEVTVDGEGAHGEGYVNVTVKPGEDQHVKSQSYWGDLKGMMSVYVPPNQGCCRHKIIQTKHTCFEVNIPI